MTNYKNSNSIRSRWADQFKELPNQSKFHDEARDVFRQGFFRNFKAYQEVPVSAIIEDYPSNQHRYDWYIPDLNVVIELHGAQHYKFTNRGNISYNAAKKAFDQGRARDKMKKQAAVEAGLQYVEVSYKWYGKLTEETLKELIFNE